MSELNPRQREAVRYIDGPLLVLAGAGSGKTRVITQKIAYLIQSCGISARHIAAVTFTNKASREMKSRVGQLVKGKEAHGLRVSTFHTLGLDIIRREVSHLGLKPAFSIYDAGDAMALLKELMKRQYGGDDQVERVQAQISRWKNQLLSAEEVGRMELGEDPATIAAARIYADYDRHLRAYNAVDFDDLILLPASLFMRQPEVLEQWQNRIRYLLVDEYQDTNSCQYKLVQLLVGLRGALTVVGDDDQSIYAWRGAQPENLSLLKNDFPRLKVIKLEQNYRSMGRILKVANTLIANNPHEFEKRLWSEMGFGDPIRVISTRNEEHEAEQIVADLLHHKFRHRTEFRDYAILYRSNHQSRLFEKKLRENNIPYFMSGGTSFFAHSEVKDIMAYLRLLNNPDDDSAFLRVVNTPRREIGPTTLEGLSSYAGKRGVSLFSACFEMGLSQYINERAVEKLNQFGEWLVRMGEQARDGDPVEVVKDLIKAIDYPMWLEETSRDPKTAERRLENVEDLVSWIGRVVDKSEQNDELKEVKLADIVARITLMDILERQAEENILDAVHMMTLHAAKGLEFPNVYIIGMEEEILPHRVSLEEGNVEEERRLAYVGITRAQRNLTFSLAAKRQRGGEAMECEASRFLDELPEEDLEWQGHNQTSTPEQRKERGQAHLDALKNMLG